MYHYDIFKRPFTLEIRTDMAVLSDKFQFWVVSDFVSLTQVKQLHPVNDSIEWSYKRPDGCLFFRKELDTALIFCNNTQHGIDDFDFLFGVERGESCGTVNILIQQKCGETWSNYWTGRIFCVRGKWDVSRCRVEVTCEVYDKYTCVMDHWEEDIDVALAPGQSLPRVEARTSPGTLEIYTHQEIYENNQQPDFREFNVPPPGAGWTLYLQLIRAFHGAAAGKGENRVFFIREVYRGVTAPPGTGWIFESVPPAPGYWVRPVPIYDFRELEDRQLIEGPNPDPTDPGSAGAAYNRWDKLYIANIEHAYITIPNGVRLKDAIEARPKCNDGGLIRSRFFSINPGGDAAPTNEAYEYAAANLDDIVLWQASDVARPDATRHSSTFKFRLRELLLDLNKVFNVWWYVDDQGYLRVEHISYWQQQQTVANITGSKFIEGKYQYQYDEIPKGESVKWIVDTLPRFRHPGITYETRCATKDKEDYQCSYLVPDYRSFYMDGRELKHLTSLALYEQGGNETQYLNPIYNENDPTHGAARLYDPKLFGFISESEDLKNVDFEKWTGFFIGSVKLLDSTYYLPTFAIRQYLYGGGSFYNDTNGALSLSAMLKPLHRHYRWGDFYAGEVREYIEAHTPKRLRVTQSSFVLPLCCTDPYQDTLVFKTLLGKGTQDSIKQTEPAGYLTITLKY